VQDGRLKGTLDRREVAAEEELHHAVQNV
jgi:hypothetical protein